MGRAKKPDSEKFDYKKWYEEHKEEIARKRREKYHKDKEVREKAIARARYHYWTKKRPNKMIQKVDIEEVDVQPDKIIQIRIKNPDDARYGKVIEVPVLDSGELAKLMDRTAQTLRLWERRGVIPPALWRDKRGFRLFTEDQVKAFLACKHYLELPMKRIEESVFAREIKKALEAMPDGVEVIPAKDMEVKGVCVICHSITEKVVKEYEVDHVRCQRCGGALGDKLVQEV